MKNRHSAYWYAKNCGWTYSEAPSLAAQYIDLHFGVPGEWKGVYGGDFSDSNADGVRGGGTYDHPKFDRAVKKLARERVGACGGRGGFSPRFGGGYEDILAPDFNPLLFAALIAADIGIAVGNEVRKLRDPEERARMRRELMRNLRIVRRPFYYARETARRRQLAAERRKLKSRTTYAPEPPPAQILDAWNRRKDSKEDMIRLGGMLQDLECYVDNRLRFDAHGNVVGRNGGILGWLRKTLPELAPKYKTLMRYKAMVIRLRQATATEDPEPTERMMAAPPPHPVVAEILADPRNTFESIEEHLRRALSPDEVLADPPNAPPRVMRPSREKSRRKPEGWKSRAGRFSH